jgi:hypothetical protein
MLDRLSRGLLCAALLACGADSATSIGVPPPPPPGVVVRLLFIGNSLTYTFDVPGQVAQMATRAGFATPVVTTHAFPNYSLQDHWDAQTIQPDLAEGHYDIVILQQGASTLESSGVELTQSLGLWANLARANNTRAALFVAWAPVGGNFDAGVAHHEAAATADNTALYPVAEAWREALRSDPAMPLYSNDGLHESEHGAWLAALVITAMVYDKPVASFANLFPDVITGTQEAALRAAAAKAIADHGR